MVHIKDPLPTEKSRPYCGSSRFPLSLFEWSFTNIIVNKICCVLFLFYDAIFLLKFNKLNGFALALQ